MRLHRLQITAFGPFASTVEVDFDEVGVNGLFLIHGPTGAGKTSLLDAVCFALYAGVPGARPGGRALRSDHAGREAVPTVRLEFGVGTRRFRVTRSPEFLRPKRRGDGYTKAPASVVLEEHRGGRWRGVTTRADEVGDIVTEVLGMGLAQFSKVVLLPQGEFAAFLRATADERRTLLEKLFDISTYAGVETWLADRRRELAASLADEQAGLATDLARLEDVLASVPGEVLGEPVEWSRAAVASLPALVDDVHRRLEAHAVACLAVSGDAESQAAATHAASVRAAGLAERQRRGHTARTELEAFEADSARWAALRDTVEAAARAQAVSGDLRSLARARARCESAQTAVRSGRAALARFGAEEWTPVELTGWLASLDECGTALDQAAALAQASAADRTRVGELSRSVAALRAGVDRTRAQATRATDAVDQAEQMVRAHHDAVVARQVAQGQVEAWSRLQRLGADVDAATARVAALRERVVADREREQDARETFLAAQQARIDAMAGELAARLVDGQPCAVCGASDHPRPATASSGASAEAVEAAEQRWHALRAATSRTDAELAAAQQLLTTRSVDLVDARERVAASTEASAASAPPPNTADAARAMDQARTRLAEATAVVARTGDAQTRLEQAQARRRELAEAVETAERTVATTAGTQVEVQARVTESTNRQAALLAEHERLCPCRTGTADEHQRVRAAAATLQQALEHAASVTDDADAVEASAREALRANGFETVEDTTTAALPDPDLAGLRAQLKRLDERRVAAEATLADPDVTAALAEPAVDVAGATAAADAARTALRHAQHAQTGAEAAVRAFGALRESVCARAATMGPLATRAAQVAELADTATGTGGQNALRMRLTAFVLAARLEKVAALANERLRVMGDGRYQLAHSDGLAAGGRRSGLGLVVRDQWTGQVRDTASLSGGESFMASLALALGLADAVREEAGGFDLNTLFIDEGFGTLDDESLEQVMAVLDGLRDGGRCVGVVSHVSDLRSRVPAQVRVDKTSTGSSVSVIGLDAPAA